MTQNEANLFIEKGEKRRKKFKKKKDFFQKCIKHEGLIALIISIFGSLFLHFLVDIKPETNIKFVIMSVMWISVTYLVCAFPFSIWATIKNEKLKNKSIEEIYGNKFCLKKKELLTLVDKYNNKELNLTDIEDLDLQTQIYLQTTDGISLNNMINGFEEIETNKFNPNTMGFLNQYSNIGKLLYYLTPSKLGKDFETYIERNHTHALIELSRLHPIMNNYSNLVRNLKKTTGISIPKNELNELMEVSEQVLLKLQDIRENSDDLLILEKTTEENLIKEREAETINQDVKSIINLKQYI